MLSERTRICTTVTGCRAACVCSARPAVYGETCLCYCIMINRKPRICSLRRQSSTESVDTPMMCFLSRDQQEDLKLFLGIAGSSYEGYVKIAIRSPDQAICCIHTQTRTPMHDHLIPAAHARGVTSKLYRIFILEDKKTANRSCETVTDIPLMFSFVSSVTPQAQNRVELE
jgi:hypothetical protein